ncbi:MAG: flagellar motor switch protein FliG [Oribacterium sp.]|nr:flagellar motor switch protein FliG [Oribacterium sp.]
MADEAQDVVQMDTTYGAGGQAVEDGQEALEKVANKHAHQEIKELTQKQKAALVIVAMGSDRASKIYKYLNEVDIEDITYEVARLGKTTNQQVEDTLDEFYKLCLTHKMMTDGGLDYARSVLEKAFGDTTAKNLLDKVSKTLASKPFNFFSKGDPKALLSLLQNERPQVIALIMSYMEAEQSAQVLENLPEEKRIPTVAAMATMDRVSPEAISIVEEEMKRKFSTIITSEDNTNIGGIDYVADVMNHIDRSSEKKIFDELDVSNPDLAKDIRDKMFVFEDILTMDDRSVQRFIRDADQKDIVFALKTASDEMKEIFLNNMSKREAESVQSDMEMTSNVRLKDVEEAQQRIVNLIRALEDKGEVIISKGGGEDTIIV